MHHHASHAAPEVAPGSRRIVLAGNPNTGKSVVFNALTGLYADVSNYAGTTLDVLQGRCGTDLVIDTPGVYGVSSFSEEERLARDVILDADMVVNVVDAVHLERDLFLTLQLVDLGKPLVVALNMMDEAEGAGLRIDAPGLSRALGVPVVPMVAVSGRGIDRLKRTLPLARPGIPHPALDRYLRCAPACASRAQALLIAEDDPHVAARHGAAPTGQRESLYLLRRQRADEIAAGVVSDRRPRARLQSVLGRITLHPLAGIPLLLLVLWLGMYRLIGGLIAGDVVAFTEKTVMRGLYEPWLRALASRWLAEGSVPWSLLVDEFGVLTMTVTYVLGVILPLVAGFYLLLSLLEDSGYLPRAAVLVDRLLGALGLNGRAIIPLILGFGCVTMATITTRLLGTQRERRIAVALLGLTIPCSAQMAVIATMLVPLGAPYVALYVAVIGAVFVAVGTALHRLLPGESSPLLIDLPPLRLPRPRNVLRKTWSKSAMFLREATPIFAYGSLFVGGLQISGLLDRAQDALAPLTEGWLRLPREVAAAFIMGMARRDFGAAGLDRLTLTPLQTVVALVTLTLFVPCIAAVLVMMKERGKQEGLLLWAGSWVLAFLVGGILAQAVI